MFIEPCPKALNARRELAGRRASHRGVVRRPGLRRRRQGRSRIWPPEACGGSNRDAGASSVTPAMASTTRPRASFPPCRRSTSSTSATSSIAAGRGDFRRPRRICKAMHGDGPGTRGLGAPALIIGSAATFLRSSASSGRSRAMASASSPAASPKPSAGASPTGGTARAASTPSDSPVMVPALEALGNRVEARGVLAICGGRHSPAS